MARGASLIRKKRGTSPTLSDWSRKGPWVEETSTTRQCTFNVWLFCHVEVSVICWFLHLSLAFGDSNSSTCLFRFKVKLSVAPVRALTTYQEKFEGTEAAAIHAAVRKGDLLVGEGSGVIGVKIGSKNRTALAVVRGMFKSILVDALLRCDGASLNFQGVALFNHLSSTRGMKSYLGAHYLASLIANVPALLGSLAAFGNPLGLMRDLGDGVRWVVVSTIIN